jgi:hypothetical protein
VEGQGFSLNLEGCPTLDELPLRAHLGTLLPVASLAAENSRGRLWPSVP